MTSSNRGSDALSFAYHAQSVGLAASLTRPSHENIPSQAVAALAATGGESYATVDKYNWKGLISFERASAHATGSMDHGAYNTLATVSITNLNVANMVHAELVVARVTSVHKPGDPEPHITFTGSMIRNLVVAGRTVELALDDEPFAKYPTYAAFAERSRGKGKKDGIFHDEKKRILSSSLVAKPGEKGGFAIDVPEFGTIYVAQVIMTPSYRRICMLRFRLGCPVSGDATVGDAISNGVEYWP